MIQQSSAIEPAARHMKMNGRLARNTLNGAMREALHAAMCGAGQNVRTILSALRLFCARVSGLLITTRRAQWSPTSPQLRIEL